LVKSEDSTLIARSRPSFRSVARYTSPYSWAVKQERECFDPAEGGLDRAVVERSAPVSAGVPKARRRPPRSERSRSKPRKGRDGGAGLDGADKMRGCAPSPLRLNLTHCCNGLAWTVERRRRALVRHRILRCRPSGSATQDSTIGRARDQRQRVRAKERRRSGWE